MQNSIPELPDAQDFIDHYAHQDFKHQAKLLEGLNAGDFDVSSYTGGPKNRMTAKMFCDIYGRKAKQLTSEKDEYSKNLLDELIDLCKNLTPLGDNIIDVWSFSSEVAFYNVFVDRRQDKIVATVFTPDKDEDDDQESD
jgi:hypothetical protein